MRRSARSERRHARRLQADRRRRACASLGISAALLALGAGLLTLHTRSHEPGQRGIFTAFQVAPLPAAEDSAPAATPPSLPPLPAHPRALEVEPLVALEVAPPSAPVLAEPELPPPADLIDLPAEAEAEAAPPAPRRAVAAHTPPARRAAPAAAPAPPAAAAAEGDITPPAYLHAPKPPYPTAMRQSRLEGTVRLRIALDAAGLPRQVDVITGSGHTDFDTTARLWVLKHWRFSPARRGAQPIPGSVITSVHFVLN